MSANSNRSPSTPVRALVVDDSALFRKLISGMLEADGSIEVVDTAVDPLEARRKIKALNPDVLTLDVEMSGMDGITFLRNLMRLRPMPVVMVSSFTERGADVTIEALSLGAVDFVCKPKSGAGADFNTQAAELRHKVLAASRARVSALRSAILRVAPKVETTTNWAPDSRSANQLIAIGASTGGTEAVRELLAALPDRVPGVVIAQHIPRTFSAAFARRLNDNTKLVVKEAADGDHILPGHAYVAPGDAHLLVVRSGNRTRCRLSAASPVNLHRPSVDVLFESVRKHVGPDAVGVLLTGMGTDGAHGLRCMRNAGAFTICQDEASSVVWGMPGSAVKMGAAATVLPLGGIGQAVLSHLSQSDPSNS